VRVTGDGGFYISAETLGCGRESWTLNHAGHFVRNTSSGTTPLRCPVPESTATLTDISR